MPRNAFRFDFRGESHELRVDYSDDMLRNVRSLSHEIRTTQDYVRFIGDDPYGAHVLGLVVDPIVDLLGERLDTEAGRTDALRYCLAFTQSIAYATERGEYPRYASEMVMDGHGDCEDSAILFGAFARWLDYKCAFLLVGRSGFLGWGRWAHMDIGVVASFPGEFSGSYYELNGARYYYCSCNGRNREIGDIPETFATPAEIIPILVEPGGDQEGPGPHRHEDIYFCYHCRQPSVGWHPTRCPNCPSKNGRWWHASTTVFCPSCGELNPAIDYLENGCGGCGFRAAGVEALSELFRG